MNKHNVTIKNYSFLIIILGFIIYYSVFLSFNKLDILFNFITKADNLNIINIEKMLICYISNRT